MDSSLETTPLKKRDRQKQDREQRILVAARHLFDRKGYAGTAMEDIAGRANLAVGTLYNYFPSKDDLLLAIMRRDSDHVIALAERILAAPPADPVEAIAALADAFIQSIAAEERMLWREVFAASIASYETLGARMFALDARMIEMFGAMIDKLKERRQLAAEIDSPRAAGLLYGICLTWSIAYATQANLTLETMSTEISQSVAMAVRGMLPRATEENPR
ncbi:MAG TPA: TetR/AcrR family transcriptional regulator [Candidatus Binataceae bacterium]|nr:TetR/AcrR family transcriptional regulator [Candidatus Binataceae bacterium]